MSYEDRLGDYVQVKDRLVAALAKHPKLVVIEEDPQIVTIGDRIFISVTVELWDETIRISRATAWEPFPGRTPYTRDSEQQNASTSALGRALGFLGFGIGKSIATREDVFARSSGDEAPAQGIPRPDHPSMIRTESRAPLKVVDGPPRTFPNKFAKPCSKCGIEVPAGVGVSWKDGDKYKTAHIEGGCDLEEPF